MSSERLNVKQVIDGVAGDSGELDRPLKIGKKWHSITWFDNPNGVSGVWDLEREVVAIEKNKVDAGDFETFKIVAQGQWVAREDARRSSSATAKVDLRWSSGIRLRSTYVARETRSYACAARCLVFKRLAATQRLRVFRACPSSAS